MKKESFNYPYMFDDDALISASSWLKILGANILAFILLSTSLLQAIPIFGTPSLSHYYHPTFFEAIQIVSPGILFLVINFLGFYWGTNGNWRRIFRPLKGKAWLWIVLFIFLTWIVGSITGGLASHFFGSETNPQDVLSASHSGAWTAFWLVRLENVFQLLGEEFLALMPFLAFAQLGYHWGWSKKRALLFGLVVSSVIFGLYHISTYGYNVGYAILGLTFTRIAMTMAYMKTKSIWASYAVHFTFDFLSFLISFLLV